MKKKKDQKIIFLLTAFFIGCFGGGLVAGKIIKHISPSSLALSGADKTAMVITACVSLFISYLLIIIIHEAGHLVFGLLSGYKYLLFRVGSLTLIKRNNKFEFKKMSIKGTAGQCVLMPPESKEPEKVPFFLYHAGGGIFNILTALITFPIAFSINGIIIRTFLLVLGAMSLVIGFTNLIPMIIQVPNDGYNIMMMQRNPAERVAIYKTLKVNGLLFNGMTLSQISPELLNLGSEGFYKAAEELLKGQALMDKMDYEGAEKILSEAASDDKIKYYQLESLSELMFCKIMNGASAEEIEKIYDQELAKYITSAGKTFISKRRLMYAYQLLIKHDAEAAEKEYQAAMKLKDTYPIEGEIISELKLINEIRKHGEIINPESIP